MYYGAIKMADIANGPGVRVSLFVSGCRNHCEGCFQPETWDFKYGQPYTEDTERSIVYALNTTYIEGLSILGGEPMEPENQEDIYGLIKAVRIHAEGRNIWVYSGYTLEELLTSGRLQTEYTHKILKNIDVLVDGKFEQSKHDISLVFRGSSNQRIINMNETMKDPFKVVLSSYHSCDRSRLHEWVDRLTKELYDESETKTKERKEKIRESLTHSL